MSNQQGQSFSDFEALLALWKGAYQSAVVSYVGLKTALGPRLLFGRVLLEPTRVEFSSAIFEFETEHVLAARYVTGAAPADVKSFISKARNGEILAVDGKCLPIQFDGNLSTYFSPIYHPAVSEGPRLPSLRITGNSKHNLIVSVGEGRVLDRELKAAETPFDNLDDLLAHMNLPTQMQMGDLTTLEIVARAPAMIATASIISGNDAVVECHLAAALDPEKLRLGFKAFYTDMVDRRSVKGAAVDWRLEGDTRIGTYRATVTGATLLQAFVSYAGISQHQWWVTDPTKHLNPRHAIHQAFDEDMELIKRLLLRPETDKSYVFEGAVSTLCHLLGFAVVNYGRIPKLQKGPDVIAVTPAGRILIIECTVGLLNENDKLAKLVQRTKLIKERLMAAGYGHVQVQSVIITPLSKDEVVVSLDTAGKHQIAVICKEEIEDLLGQVVLPPNPEKLFHDTFRLVPGVKTGSLF